MGIQWRGKSSEGRPAAYHLYMSARCTLRGPSANGPMSKLTIIPGKAPGVDKPPGILIRRWGL